MRGDRIVNTPFEIFMKKDTTCSALCTPEHSRKLSKEESERLRNRIKEDYHVHLLVDNLPCATKYTIPETNEAFYDHGYKLGWTDGNKIFVNNHLEILLKVFFHFENLIPMYFSTTNRFPELTELLVLKCNRNRLQEISSPSKSPLRY